MPEPCSRLAREQGLYARLHATSLMLKDLRLAQKAAGKAGAASPLGAAATQLYALYAAHGGGGKDFSGIIEMLRGDG